MNCKESVWKQSRPNQGVYPDLYLEGQQKTIQKSPVGVACVSATIQTGYFLNIESTVLLLDKPVQSKIVKYIQTFTHFKSVKKCITWNPQPALFNLLLPACKCNKWE
jgi:hypothetical protein